VGGPLKIFVVVVVVSKVKSCFTLTVLEIQQGRVKRLSLYVYEDATRGGEARLPILPLWPMGRGGQGRVNLDHYIHFHRRSAAEPQDDPAATRRKAVPVQNLNTRPMFPTL